MLVQQEEYSELTNANSRKWRKMKESERKFFQDMHSHHLSITTGVSSELAPDLDTTLTRKSKTSVAITAEATSSLWSVLLFPCSVTFHDLWVNSSMNSSQAFEKIIGASPDIIFTSSPDLFMIFLILAKGNKCGPVLPDIPPFNIPEYVPACLILSFSFSIFHPPFLSVKERIEAHGLVGWRVL